MCSMPRSSPSRTSCRSGPVTRLTTLTMPFPSELSALSPSLDCRVAILIALVCTLAQEDLVHVLWHHRYGLYL